MGEFDLPVCLCALFPFRVSGHSWIEGLCGREER